ncbi:MAG: hypothetical protein R6U67_09250 [Sodalinema sp.]|uniref:hypothetical protein n=1 Tax=Sodalinema sp. TaxID=3080550 RepID=UPI00396F5BD4
MLPFDLIALAIAAGCLYWFRQTSEDIYSILAAMTGLVSLVVGFALAPWPVQVAIVLALWLLERLWVEPKRRRGSLYEKFWG